MVLTSTLLGVPLSRAALELGVVGLDFLLQRGGERGRGWCVYVYAREGRDAGLCICCTSAGREGEERGEGSRAGFELTK